MYFLGSEWIIRVLLHLWLNGFCTGWPTTAPADESSMILVAADRSDFVTSTAWPPEVAARSWYSWKSDLVIGVARWPWGLLASRRLGSVSKKVTWSVNGEMELQKKPKQISPGRLCVSLGLFEIERMTTLTGTSYHRFCAFYQGGDCTFEMKVLGRCIREDKDLRGGGSSSQGQLSITKTDRKF